MADKRQETQALGRAIREVRVERGFAQDAFAAHAGMDRSYFGAIERGEFNVTYLTILKIARGLGVRPSELMLRAGL